MPSIGVTAFLKVEYKLQIKTKSVLLEVKIDKQEKSKTGKLMTYISGKIYDDINLYTTYNGLFIESPLIPEKEYQKGTNDIDEFTIVRENTLPIYFLNVKDLYDTNDNIIIWKNGYGPPNHVHGGIISFPFLNENKHISKIKINYKKAIPLLSESRIDIYDNKFKITNDKNDIQAEGEFY